MSTSQVCTIGLDLGTTSVSAIAVDAEGTLLQAVSRPHRADIKGLPAGHAEQDPLVIRDTAESVLCELTAACAATPVCLGFTGQMHGVVLLDDTLEPVSNLITWQDRRSLQPHPSEQHSLLESLLSRCSDDALLHTGCRLAAGYLGTTLYCLKQTDALPPNASRTALIVDWLAAKLTGGNLITDRSNAASTGLYDLQRDEWSPELLSAAGLNHELLPIVAESGGAIGRLTTEAARRTGLPEGLPVANAIGDNQAAILGSIPVGEEVIHINIGTGGQLSRIIDRFQTLAGMETRYLPVGRCMLVGAGLAGGDALAWVKRTLSAWLESCGLTLSDDELYSRLTEQIASAPAYAKGLECAPFFRGTRAQPDTRGAFRGIDNRNFTPGNVGRAVLNGIVAGMEMFRDLAASAGDWQAQRIIATGNAVRRNPLLAQCIADRFGLPVDLPTHREEAAYGTALLAGAQTGVWPGLEAAGRQISHERAARPGSVRGPTD